MNVLSYSRSDELGLTFELYIDGVPLSDLIGTRNVGIPYWIIGDSLPTWPPHTLTHEADTFIVSVCACGEYGCNHTRCQITTEIDLVTFRNFEGDVANESTQIIFRFTRKNYDSVVDAIVHSVREFAKT